MITAKSLLGILRASLGLLVLAISFGWSNDAFAETLARKDGPRLVFEKMPIDSEASQALRSMGGATIGKNAASMKRATAPQTVQCNTIVLETEAWDVENCDSAYIIRAGVPLVWGTYVYLEATQPLHIRFDLTVTGPEPFTYSSWHDAPIEPGVLYKAWVEGIDEKSYHLEEGTYTASLILTPEGGKATFLSREYSNYVVLYE